MSKRLTLIVALALLVVGAGLAYAEVQNVKVSGDITAMGVYRNNLDLRKESVDPAVGVIQGADTGKNAITITRVKVDADLTDNVSTTVRLLNERNWGREGVDANANTNVAIDLAYATMKEFLYSPLTLTVGRQELHFGNDLIIGDPDTNQVAFGSPLVAQEQDLSARKAFDAVRATLNYDPLVLDLIWAKIAEGAVQTNDDTTLYGMHANYALTKATNLQGYGFVKTIDSNTTPYTAAQRTSGGTLTAFGTFPNTTIAKADKVYTIGGRVSNSSIKDLSLSLESAFQFGRYNPAFDINSNNNAKMTKRQAWALQAIAGYDMKDVKNIGKYAPMLTGSYTYLSGDNSVQKNDNNAWRGWDPMFENQTLGHLENEIMGFTNTHALGIDGKMKPVEDITLDLSYSYYWLAKAFRGGVRGIADTVNMSGVPGGITYLMTHDQHLGQEIDAKVSYDYTEDVQFSLLGGWFVPGDAFEKGTNNGNLGNRNTAQEVIGTMKVTF